MSEQAWVVADLSPEERKLETPELSDKTPIVRYVQLSTLFLYLSGRAFIPSLELLHSKEEFEGIGGVASVHPKKFQEALASLLEKNKDFLPARPEFAPTHPAPDVPKELLDFGLHLRRWTGELAKRRAVWCWNLFESESNAMWQLYGSRGVAVKSTVGHLKKALANSGCVRRVIAPVRYGPPPDLELAAVNFKLQNKATWPSWFKRPDVFKIPPYRYEQEIRFVFGVHPGITAQAGGVLIELDGKTLIPDECQDEGILFSGSIQKDEAQIIRELCKRIRSGELPGLQYPACHQDVWNRRLSLIQGSPFTPQDDPPNYFPI
jgi:hypothetical protein